MCIYPKQLLNNTKNVSIKKTLSITTVAQDVILQLWRNIQLTTMTSIVFCFFNMQWKASTLMQDLERDDIEGHLLEQLLKPIHALKNNLPLKCGKC